MQISKSIGLKQILFSISSGKTKIFKLIDYCGGSLLAWLLPAKKPNLPTSGVCRNILIIRPGGIGDAIFLIPFLRQLRQTSHIRTIHILCEKRNQEAFLSQPVLFDQIFCYDNLSDLRSLFKQKYDLVVDTEQWHYLSAMVSYLLPHQYSLGFSSRPLRAKLFHHTVEYDQNAYELKNFYHLLQSAYPTLSPIADINNSFPLSAETETFARSQIPEKSVTIFLGASIPIRRINENQCLEIIHFLMKQGWHTALLGGSDVGEIGERISRGLSPTLVSNFVGKISLLQSAALIKRSKLFIGPDSGLMHLACAVGTPVIGIFGPGNLNKWSPQGIACRVITENLPCSPCTRFGYTVPTCHGQYQCMRDIKIQEIFTAIQELTSSSEKSRNA